MAIWKIGILTFMLTFITQASVAESYIGIILDGYQEDCKVKHKNVEYNCSEKRGLLEGDEIIKKPDIEKLEIKWAPYTSGKKLNETTLQVIFKPPDKNKKGILNMLMEFIGFVKTEHKVFKAATRGGAPTSAILFEKTIPQPCDNATVISHQKIPFIWEGGGERIVFKDSKGVTIFQKEIKGESSIQLTTEEIGMKPSETYTWSVEGAIMKKPFMIQLLRDKIAEQITSDLKEIDNEKITDSEKWIKKSAYLQFMSDIYPEEIDLYWLSHKFFMENIKDENKLNEEEKGLLERLTRHCKYL